MKRSNPAAGKRGKILSPRSPVWQFFELNRDDSLVRCRFCEKTLAYTGGTTNLRYHLTAAHSMEEFEVVGPSAKIYKPGGRPPGSGVKRKPPPTKITSKAWDSSKTTNSAKKDAASAVPKTSTKEATPDTPSSPLQASPLSSPVHHSTSFMTPSKTRARRLNVDDEETTIAPILLQMLVQSLQPLSFAYSVGFKAYMRYLEPTCKIPSKEKLQNSLLGMYERCKIQLKDLLNEEATYFSIVYDLWKASDHQTYTTITINYLTDEWERKSFILGTDHITSSSEISNFIRELLYQYDLPEDRMVAILDRKGMLKSWVDDVGSTLVCESLSCAAEKLESCVLTAYQVPEVKALIEQAGLLVSYLLCDDDASKLFHEIKESGWADSKTHLVQNRKENWVATSEMLFKMLDLRHVIEKVESQDAKNGELYLSNDQWRLTEKLVSSLQILRAALAVMSKDKTGSVSCLLPVVHSILQHCEDSSHGPNSPMDRFLKIIGMETREKWDLTAILPSSVPMLAALLDPRFKKLKFIAEEDKVDVLDALKGVMAATPGLDGENNISGDSEASPFLCLFGNAEEYANRQDIDSEISSYMTFPALRHDNCPLDWWRVNKGRFPHLAKLARQFLCVPAISQSMSDIMAGSSMTDLRRALLEVEFAAPLIFMNHNWSLTHS